MTDHVRDPRPQAAHPKIGPAHLGRAAVVYVRQSTPGQTERNVESTDRQYALVERAVELGWSRRAVEVIDEDLGVSGAAGITRSGFARLTSADSDDSVHAVRGFRTRVSEAAERPTLSCSLAPGCHLLNVSCREFGSRLAATARVIGCPSVVARLGG